MAKGYRGFFAAGVLAVWGAPLAAHGPAGTDWMSFPEPRAETPAGQPAALIIDDVGDDRAAGRRAIDLDAGVTLSVLPHTPHGRYLAERAHERGREVMLHLPMEAKNGADPGPGALFLDMDEVQVRETVARALEAVPHAAGVNNHMGSLITRHPGHMTWLMEELAARDDLYFIDSRTSARSVAQWMADEQGVDNAVRHVFLDPQRDADVIAEQFERFVALAQQGQGVIAIGHPYPETLDLLEEELPGLRERGVTLVPAGELVDEPATDPIKGDRR
ncbi:MAG: divergent polysaccharide deacetylase family protein [Halorhodospira halophila]|uniref:divergent polysaccharide deacetylase family protein n=1 Tax=Halorhodospira halophila TaxID=1053 RepID=UPI0026EEC2E7|nr:divergent polysaccharide deacetylase family protein [Halorhodospira halophila]MCC3750131.1 divergent polysaccharide deacetylase family protein [Halorhodospira halophila]